LEILRLVAEGLRNKEIAAELFNSEETIKKHLSNMFLKMEVKNRLSLVSKAKEVGILV
jgi:DNA-binding NarL/FixJ family response regulator